MKKIVNNEEVNPFFTGVKYSILSFAISIIFMLIFAIVLTNTEVSESTINPVIMVITGISILITSFIASKKIRNKGIVCGGIMGASYFILLYILSSIFSMTFSLNMYSIIMMFICIITGMFGGVLGVNFVRK